MAGSFGQAPISGKYEWRGCNAGRKKSLQIAIPQNSFTLQFLS
jgi:hypothetical protein